MLEDMAAILRAGGYPVEVTLRGRRQQACRRSRSAVLADLREAIIGFAEPPPAAAPPAPAAKATAGGFFLPDAFTNPDMCIMR